MTPEWMKKWEPGMYERIKAAASRHGLEPEWVAAIVQVESAGNPSAVRFEANWRYFCNVQMHAKRLRITEDSEKTLQQFSWGLMQVMGSVAREWGYPDPLFTLCEHSRSLEYGCRHLKNMRRRFPTGRDWIAAYNAGSPRKRPDGTYENESYVRKVVAFWSDLTDS